MTIDIVSNERELLLLQPEWDALWSSVESPCYFLSFSYTLACWQEMFKSRRTLLRCIVIRDSGKVVLLWPLIVTRIGILRMLKPLASGAAEYSQPLVKEGPEAVELCALAWQSARSRIKSDIISMTNVKENCCLQTVLSRERAFSVDKDVSYLQRGGDTWKDWDTYFKAVSAGHKPELKYHRRLLGKQGTVGFETLEAPVDIAATLDWCLRLKREWAERVNKRGAWLYSDSYRNFLIALFAREDSAEQYIAFLLTLDGSPIAAWIAVKNRVKLEGILSCFDARWRKYSPGSLLQECVARWVVERSLEHDFGVGTETYKKFWSCNNVIAVAGYKFSRTLLGRLALEVLRWRRKRANALKKDERALGAPAPAGESS